MKTLYAREIDGNLHSIELYDDCEIEIKTIVDIQKASKQKDLFNFSEDSWECWICGKSNNLSLHACARIPKHITSFEVTPQDHILTTVCESCIKNEVKA